MQALGFIETKGLVASIEAADAMLKAAEVVLLEQNMVGSGLVTISITGEVSAVQAAVDAGVACVARMHGELVSRHVIPRPDESIDRILQVEPSFCDIDAEESPAPCRAEEKKLPQPEEKTAEADVPAATSANSPARASSLKQEKIYSSSALKKMSMNALRRIVSEQKGIAPTDEVLQSADKKTLMNMILHEQGQK